MPVRRRVAGMKRSLLMIAVVMGQSVLAADKKSLTKEESASNPSLRGAPRALCVRFFCHLLKDFNGED